jgi:hypothetical protein
MTVEAKLHFLTNADENPVVYNYKVSDAERKTAPQFESRHVSIENARSNVDGPTLTERGFELADQQTSIGDFYDDAEVRASYYKEMEELVARETGARRVLAFDHNVRCLSRSQQGESGIQGPIKTAHNDYTADSAAQRIRDLVAEDEASERLAARHAVINTWRSIRSAIESHPLAVCDATSIAETDMVSIPLVYPDRTGVVQIMSFEPDQRWYYYPQMQQDEVLLLECFDSLEKDRSRYTAHTAFEDPTTPQGARERESIEVRTLVFY